MATHAFTYMHSRKMGTEYGQVRFICSVDRDDGAREVEWRDIPSSGPSVAPLSSLNPTTMFPLESIAKFPCNAH